MHPIEFTNTEAGFRHLSNAELKRSIFIYSIIQNPTLVKIGTFCTNLAFKIGLPIQGIVKATIFKQFCGGENLEECLQVAMKLEKSNVATILDYGLEGLETEKEFDEATNFFIQILQKLHQYPSIPVISIKITALASFELLEHVSSGHKLREAELKQWEIVRTRFFSICTAAVQSKTAVYVDAEESWIQLAIDALVEEAMQVFNTENVYIFQTAQMYRHDRLAYIKRITERAKQENWKVGLKIVRGAYMLKENKRALEMDYLTPIQPTKAATDFDYNAALKYCIQHVDNVSICVATHNAVSCALTFQLLEEHNIAFNHPHIVFCQLYGMSDIITFSLSELGCNSAKYLPFGPIKKVMPYLIRRAQENSSVQGEMGRELAILLQEKKRRNL